MRACVRAHRLVWAISAACCLSRLVHASYTPLTLLLHAQASLGDFGGMLQMTSGERNVAMIDGNAFNGAKAYKDSKLCNMQAPLYCPILLDSATCVSAYCYVCPHTEAMQTLLHCCTAIYVSAHCGMCVRILRYVCPHPHTEALQHAGTTLLLYCLYTCPHNAVCAHTEGVQRAATYADLR